MNLFNAGCLTCEVADPQLADMIPLVAIYPTNSSEEPETLGPYTVNVAMHADVAPGLFSLVVISHGTGGSHLAYRTLAMHLARHGFVVVMPEHPRNNRNNNELGGTDTILGNRPKHIRAVIDWALRYDAIRPSLRTATVAMIGHSLGGYTALAVAGGKPTAFPHETADRQSRKIDVVPDSRIKALVLLAPATVWFMAPGALDDVRIPILMLTAEKDPHTPPMHGEIVKRGVAGGLLEHRMVANAGHFSFLSPFPAGMTNPAFPPSQDPHGFDRAQFHDAMYAEVLSFLRRAVPADTLAPNMVP